MYDFVITNHARERFVERFSKESNQFVHLSKCRSKECPTCRDLAFTLSELVEQYKSQWDRIMCGKLHDAEDIKVIHNNVNFMDYLYKKHGFYRFNFLVEGDILFITIDRSGSKVVLTCMDVNNPVNGTTLISDFVNRPKFRKRKVLSHE